MQHFLSYTLTCLAVLSLPAIASDRLEEIVVTADFRDTNLMETAASISVLDESLIVERGAQQQERPAFAHRFESGRQAAFAQRFAQFVHRRILLGATLSQNIAVRRKN